MRIYSRGKQHKYLGSDKVDFFRKEGIIAKWQTLL